MNSAMHAESGTLQEILRHPAVWRGCDLSKPTQPSMSSGFTQLDCELPGGGWPTGMLIEILPRHEGIGELRLLAPVLSSLCAQGKFIIWIGPPHMPYAPALMAAGIDLSHVVVVRAAAQDALWAVEQALRSNACGAVLAWPLRPRFVDLRRLQLAAEGRQSLAVLFRSINAATDSSPAPLRLELAAHAQELAVHILKRRGRPAATPILLSMPAIVRDRVYWNVDALDCNSSASPAARDLRRIIHV